MKKFSETLDLAVGP